MGDIAEPPSLAVSPPGRYSPIRDRVHSQPHVHRSRSRSASPSRSSTNPYILTPSPSHHSLPLQQQQRYSLPPIRTSDIPHSPSLQVPSTLPRLVLKPTDHHSRHNTAYSTMRSSGSGSTSPADYVGGGVQHLHHERRFSGESAASRLSRSQSVASASSLPPDVDADADAAGEIDDERPALRPVERRKEPIGNGRVQILPQVSGWRYDGEMDRATSGPGVTPGAVLPPIPRTTKVVVPAGTANGHGGGTVGTAPQVRLQRGGGGQMAKSRKSSCDLCHHRKIRCDQGRPSCGSCTRKGHICVYADDADRSVMRLVNGGQRAVTIVSATDPNEKTTIIVPRPDELRKSPHPPMQRAAGPTWSATRGQLPTPISASTARFDSSTAISSMRTSNGSRAGSGSAERTGPEQDGSTGKTTHEDLAEIVNGELKIEVDELESDGEHETSGGRGSAAMSGSTSALSGVGSGKRATSGEEELNGELLELATGHPRKKKARHSASSLHSRSANGHGHPPHSRGDSGASNASSSRRQDNYSASISSLITSLPSSDTQRILLDTFFDDPYLSEGITLLKPKFLDALEGVSGRAGGVCREGDATTLANAFAILATSLRIMPDETSRLLLASSMAGMQGSGHLQPRSLSRILAPSTGSDNTPLDQRYFDLALICAQLAESVDPPSPMLVMLKLILYRNLEIKKDRNVIAGQYLAGAIRIAQALGMGKEWEGIPLGERELRRRVMWTLYIADRQLSFETAFPYTILDAHQGIHLPSPISEEDLYKIAADATSLPPHQTEVGPTPCTALFIHTHLARRVTPILDSFATVSPSFTQHDLVLRFDQSLDHFQDALPPYMRLFPGTDTRFDNTHTYLSAHRTRLHARILAYRQGVHRSFITTYLRPSAPAGIRGVMANICLSSLRTQRSAKMLDPKIAPRIFDPLAVFESAMILGLIIHVDKTISASGPATEAVLWRDGLASGIELLDNTSMANGSEVSRRGVRVLREMSAKVDQIIKEKEKENSYVLRLPWPKGFQKLTIRSNSDNTEKARSATPPEKSTAGASPDAAPATNAHRVKAVDEWLDGLVKDTRRTLEVLLRDPKLDGGWDRVLAQM